MTKKILYISYDGLLEPLGQSQVFEYLQNLANEFEIALVSYEKPEDWANTKQRNLLIEEIQTAGIRWIPLRYHKRPTALATAYDLIAGFAIALYLILRDRIQIIHARSYVPSVLALSFKQLLGTRFIFDMRGFWADERVDAGIWPQNSPLYKIAKWFERQFLTRADVVISLTHAGVEAMREFPYLQERIPRFEVIPTCTNLDIFHPLLVKNPTKNEPFTLGYVGSVNGWYLFEPVLECFKILQKLQPDARLLILNRGDRDYIQNCLKLHEIDEGLVELKAVHHREVTAEMHRMNAGIFFIKPVFSKRGSAATKLGEFLGCGIPCLSNDGVGDMTEILEKNRVGIVLREFTPQAQAVAVQQLLQLVEDPKVSDRCVATARFHFSLEKGVNKYRQVYESQHQLLVKQLRD